MGQRAGSWSKSESPILFCQNGCTTSSEPHRAPPQAKFLIFLNVLDTKRCLLRPGHSMGVGLSSFLFELKHAHWITVCDAGTCQHLQPDLHEHQDRARRSDGGVSARSGRQVCVRAVRVAYITSSPQETGWAVGKNTQA
eukprot:1150477-Pelagomonas_calceolata.AAC.1